MKKAKTAISILLCAAMLFSVCACGKKEEETVVQNTQAEAQQVEYTDVPTSVSKTETVYVSMDNSGKVTSTSVTDWIHTDKPQVQVKDKSNLTDIVNVKTNEAPKINGENIVWNMNTTDLYYHGKTNKAVPISFDISYSLNGKQMTAQEIAGKSGHAVITIKPKNSYFKECEINGIKRKVYLPVLVAGGAILQESNFTGIKVESGISVGDGTKQIAAVAGAPGLCESLGINKDDIKSLTGLNLTDTFVISADTSCFEISDFYFAAIPFCSINVELVAPDSVSKLAENLANLKKVFSCLENIDKSSIISIISGSIGSADELISTINSAMDLYSKNEALLKLGSKYCTDENLSALGNISELMSDEDFAKGLAALGKTDLSGLVSSLPEVTSGLEKIAPLLKNDTVSKALELLSSSVMVKFFKQLPALADSLASVQALVGNNAFINALNTLSDPSVAVVFEKLPELMTNAEALQPLLGSLQTDLEDPEVKSAIENLPKTVKDLNKLIETVNKNSDVINKLISFASDKNVKELIKILQSSDIDTKELEQKLNSVLNNTEDVVSSAKEWITFGKSYRLFTQSTEDQKTGVVFIYNTPAIEKAKIVEAKKEEKEVHWYTRILDIFIRKE